MDFKKLFLKILLFLIILVPFVYIALVSHLTKSKSDEDFSILYAKLKDREYGAESFKQFVNRGKTAGDYLANKIASEKDDLTKVNAIQIIGITGCTNCEQDLSTFLNDPNWRMRFFALDTLDKLNYDRMSPLLHKVIKNDVNKNMKIKAIMILGKCGSKNDIIFLKNLRHQREYDDQKISKAIDIAIEKLKLRLSDKS